MRQRQRNYTEPSFSSIVWTFKSEYSPFVYALQIVAAFFRHDNRDTAKLQQEDPCLELVRLMTQTWPLSNWFYLQLARMLCWKSPMRFHWQDTLEKQRWRDKSCKDSIGLSTVMWLSFVHVAIVKILNTCAAYITCLIASCVGAIQLDRHGHCGTSSSQPFW